MASLLSPEQTELYRHTCDIYPALALNATRAGGVTDPGFSPTPVATNVPFYRETRPNFDNPSVVGRIDQTDVFTSDIGHFPIDYDDTKPSLSIGANYLIVFTTPGHPEQGRSLMTLGVNMVKNLMANKQMFYMKFVPLPKFLIP